MTKKAKGTAQPLIHDCGTLEVKHLPPEALKPYWRNTKKHSEAQLRQMAKLLDKYHFDQPIVVDKNMVIIKGHGRYMAALMSKVKRLVPVVVRHDLTDDQTRAARISDNRIFDLGEAIPELIKSEVMDYVLDGGTGAEVFFDFIAAPPPQFNPNVDPVEEPTEEVPEEEPEEEDLTEGQGTEEQTTSSGEDTSWAPPNEDVPEEPAPVVEKPEKVKKKEPIYCPHCNQLHTED